MCSYVNSRLLFELAMGRVEVCVQNRCGTTCDDYLDLENFFLR